MEIALALVIAAALGIGVHFLLPHRRNRGAFVAPLIAAAVGAVAWTALTWADLGADNPWIWVTAVIAPIVVSAALTLGLSLSRVRGDHRERERLGLA